MKDLIEKINKLKKEKNAVILAHCYQNIEIDEVADFVGDSLYLSRMAAKTDADIIVFAGVYFMAETAKILSPEKKVLLPKLEAGCKMADMIDLPKLRAFKAEHPDSPVVCYVNSTAEVKSECDICCTSANAYEVVKSLNSKEVLFVPDANLGHYVETQSHGVKVIGFDGCCPIHADITAQDVLSQKEKYPDALVMVHPECKQEVIDLADYTGSTTGIMKYCRDSQHKQFIIVTEVGVVERLKRDLPEKEFILIHQKALCESMKCISLEDILNSLENETHQIDVEPKVAQKAFRTIERMLKI